MATQPNLSDGSTIVTLKINNDITENESPNIVRHSIPSRDGDVLQIMGRGSKVIPLRGYTTVQSEKTQLQTWTRDQTSLTYNDDENTNMKCRITTGANFTRKPSQPGYYEYQITIVEDE